MNNGMVHYSPTFHSYIADCLCGWGIHCGTADQATQLLDHHEKGCNA